MTSCITRGPTFAFCLARSTNYRSIRPAGASIRLRTMKLGRWNIRHPCLPTILRMTTINRAIQTSRCLQPRGAGTIRMCKRTEDPVFRLQRYGQDTSSPAFRARYADLSATYKFGAITLPGPSTPLINIRTLFSPSPRAAEAWAPDARAGRGPRGVGALGEELRERCGK